MRTLLLSPLALLALLGCVSPAAIDHSSIVGQRFPSVTGESLDGRARTIPDDLLSDADTRPALLLVGYKQFTQFDIDRWMVGVLQLQTPVEMVEIPTIAGMVPGLFAKQIDEGMRGGIPKELWASVVTVYSDADKIQSFTGTANPMPARVLLLDSVGRVVWFHDRGFSPVLAQELDAKVRNMSPR
jgi:hypothetical protein